MDYKTWASTDGRPVIDSLAIIPEPFYDVAILAVRTAYLAGRINTMTEDTFNMGKFANDVLKAYAEGVK